MHQVELPLLETVPDADEEAGLGTLSTSAGNLPLQAVSVRTRIAGLLAHTELRQTFFNSHDEPLEATYIFPLPDGGAVTQFVLEVAGRKVEGVLEERQRARREYEKAIRRGHRAAIAEEERPNVFTIRVGNLPPREQAEVTLSLALPLTVDNGEVTYRFPLVVAPRYIPGTPMAGDSVGDGVVSDTDQVPDASRITPPVLLPGFPNPVQLSLEVELDTLGLPVDNLRSSLHGVTTKKTAQTYHVRLDPGERLDRDFILRYDVAAEELRVGALLAPDENDAARGTFAVLVTAPKTDAAQTAPRDVVFVLDRSGSMDGWKIVAARRALGRLIDSLNPQDRFAVIAFDTMTTSFDSGALTPAVDRTRYRALEWVAGIDARGGTEMLPALRQALMALDDRRDDAAAFLVLFTDGQVGNEAAILTKMKHEGVSVLTVGIDMALNDAFLRRLAEETGGVFEPVESEDRLDEVKERIQERLNPPVLRKLTLRTDGVGLEPDCQVPQGALSLFSGATRVVTGRWHGDPTAARFHVSAVTAEGAPWRAEPALEVKPHPALRPVWARGLIQDLEDQYQDQPSPDLEKRLLELSLQHGVLCRFTAYVAIDHAEVVTEGGKPRRIVQPVEAAAGWDMLRRETVGVRERLCEAPPPPCCAISLDRPSVSEPQDALLESVFFTAIPDVAAQESARRSPLPTRFASPQELLQILPRLRLSGSWEVRDFLVQASRQMQEWLIHGEWRDLPIHLRVEVVRWCEEIDSKVDAQRLDAAHLRALLDECRRLLERITAATDASSSRRDQRWWAAD